MDELMKYELAIKRAEENRGGETNTDEGEVMMEALNKLGKTRVTNMEEKKFHLSIASIRFAFGTAVGVAVLAAEGNGAASGLGKSPE